MTPRITALNKHEVLITLTLILLDWKLVMWPQTCPLEGQFVILRLILHMGNQCVKFEVQRCFRGTTNLKLVTWCDHAPLRDGLLLSVGWDLIWSTCPPNLKSLHLHTTKIRKTMQNVKIGLVLKGYGSPKVIGNITVRYSTHNFLFDYNINYLYASILYHFRVITHCLSKVADFNLPHLHWHPHLGSPHSNFTKIFGIKKLESMWQYSHDPKFSHFDIVHYRYLWYWKRP